MKMPKIIKNRKGMLGVESAIILIAFVIVAAAFSFMVVNMGLFATQRGRDTISQGVQEASTPLMLDGSILIRGTSSGEVDAIIIPLKTLGVKYVPMANETTVVSLRVENHTAYANIYNGINDTDPRGHDFSELISGLSSGGQTTAVLFIENSDGDDSMDAQEKGLLIIYLASGDEADKRENVFVEIRPEKGAPLSIEFIVPSELQQGYTTIG
ncbi:flagellin [Candidatus Bathyarchaeota archaeon]|nr:flagellin [Candidatus Bathyarchaeota archaeon]